MVKLTAIQLTSVPDIAVNLKEIEIHLSALPYANEHIVVLPECCLFFGGKDLEQLAVAKESYADDSLIKQLSGLAKKYKVTLVAGSIPIFQPVSGKFANTCCVFSPKGELIGEYQKIHLFDVNVEDSEKQYRESKYTQAGNKIILANTASVTCGLTICYDLRFPELFRQLTINGAQIITVPAAFTQVTGAAHWQTLLRARAIENQVFIVAAGQQGKHENGRETYGHSMIIDPWGEILAQLPVGNGSVSAEIELDKLKHVRAAIPVAQHNQFITKLK